MGKQTKPDDNLIILFLKICKKNWIWFVFSTLFFCALAAWYFITTPKTYRRTASVMIREETPMSDVQAAFSDSYSKSLTNANNVNNEIEAFKSPHLMYEVISRLNLTTNYVRLDGFRKYDLYAHSPIRVNFLDANEDDAFSFHLEKLSDSTFLLSKIVWEKGNYEINMEVKLYDSIATPFGKMIITPTKYYLPDNVGTYQITKYKTLSLLDVYKNKYSVSLSNKLNDIIILDFDDVSMQRADDVLNTMIAVYNENWLDEKNRVALTAQKFFNERIPVIEKELRSIENELESYKSSHLLTDIKSASDLYMRESAGYTGKMVEVRNQITIAGYILDYMKDHTNSNALLPSANIGLNNTAIETQINLFNTTMNKKNELIISGGERNPALIEVNTQLKALKESILQSMENYQAGLQSQLAGLQAQESKMTQNLASNPGQEKQLMSIEREHQLKQAMYLHLLQKREENDMALVMATINTRIISPPSGSNNPVKPSKNIALLVALFFGIGIPGSLFLGKEILNTTIRSKKELEVLPVPLLGVIHKAKNREKKQILVVQEHGEGQMNEAFRSLRTRLANVCHQDMKVIQVTSMESGSGKTFMALNLAMSFAIAGKKVALLDLDLRKATISRLIGLPELGIFHLLTKQVLHERYFIEKNYFHTGFDILPTGPLPVSPSELLMSDSLEKLLQRYRNTYDYIFIDCPPADMFTDADIIAPLADLSIFVIRENYTDRRKLENIKNIVREERFKNMRLVLNDFIADDRLDKYYDDYDKNIKVLPKTDLEASPESRFLM